MANILENFFNKYNLIFDIDLFIKQKAIEIRQQNKYRMPIIAATAIQRGLSLVAADKEFQKITDLDLIVINISVLNSIWKQ
ncbi:MAG: hypothetical protein LBF08_01710 [Dysgonamonadaceae bacterium]|jgi:predicted nucleic acid-binding protein|nr:hypothetical protein [Dysgonamonadaceae bacterium]